MLDAIIPTATYATSNSGNGVIGYTAGVTVNAYRDTIAKAAGVALLNGEVGKYDGTFWRPINDAAKILSGDFVVQAAAIEIEGVSGSGLIYTGVTAPLNSGLNNKYTLNNFGISGWSIAECNSINKRWNTNNVCAIRGMLFPTFSEIKSSEKTHPWNPCGGTTDVGGEGVPSHPSGDTWTATSTNPESNYPNYFWQFENVVPTNIASYIRCTR